MQSARNFVRNYDGDGNGCPKAECYTFSYGPGDHPGAGSCWIEGVTCADLPNTNPAPAPWGPGYWLEEDAAELCSSTPTSGFEDE